MYFFFTTDLLYWQNEMLRAKLLSNISKEHELNWRSSQKLQLPLPSFTFAIHEDAPTPDNYRTAGGFYHLFSGRLIRLLNQYDVNFETYKARILGATSNKDLELDYYVFRPIEFFDCLDRDKMEFKVIPIGKRTIETFNKPVFTAPFLLKNKMMFKIPGYEQFTFIHEALKEKIEGANLTGCEFSIQNLPDLIYDAM